MKKYQILINKKRFYRFTALGLGSAIALAAPVAIVIACGDNTNSGPTIEEQLAAEVEKLDIDETNTTLDAVSWVSAIQIPNSLRSTMDRVEYLLGNYSSSDEANKATTWTATLPSTLPTDLDARKLWIRFTPRENLSAAKSVILANKVSEKLAQITTASTPSEAREFDTKQFVNQLQKLSAAKDSSKEVVQWENIFSLPASAHKDIIRVDYLIGDYTNDDDAAKATDWQSSLPTSITNFKGFSVWARFVPKPKVTLSQTYFNLTDFAKLSVLPDRTISTTPLAPASVDYGSKWQASSHRLVTETYPSPGGINNIINFDYQTFTPGTEWLSGSETFNELLVAGALTPFREVRPAIDRTNYNQTTKRIISQEATTKLRSTKIRFGLFQSITLFDEQGKSYVFDKDYSSGNDLNSSDERDINSQHFLDTLSSEEMGKRIVEFSFELNKNAENTYWIRNFSGEKSSKIQIKDFLLGLIWGVFNDSKSRIGFSGLSFSFPNGENPASGSFKFVNDAIAASLKIPFNKLPDSLKLPDPNVSESAILVLRSLIGLDISAVLDPFNESAVKTMIPDEKTFKFKFSADADSGSKRDFWEFISQGRFAAVPWDKTMELVSDENLTKQVESTLHDVNKPTNQRLSDSDWEALKNSSVYKLGFYHHFFANRNDFYSAGTYRISESGEKTIAFTINDNYIDPRWVNQKNKAGQNTTIQTFRLNFVTETSDNLPRLNEYKAGTVVSANFEGLNANEQAAALGMVPEAYGLRYSRGFTPNKKVWTELSGLTVMPLLRHDFTMHFFNDNFAKLVYGASSKEINNNQSVFEGGSLIKSLASGNGFVFRKLLMAAINGYAMVRRGMPQSFEPIDWLAVFSPEQNIWGTDEDKKYSRDNPLLLIDVLTDIENANKNGLNDEGLLAKYIFKRENDKLVEEGRVQHKSYVDQYIKSIGENRYSAPTSENTTISQDDKVVNPLAVIKAGIKELLDKEVGELLPNEIDASSVPLSKKIIWEMPYGRGGASDGRYASVRAQAVYNSLKKMLSTLDPRLDLVAAMTPSTQEEGKPATYKEATVLLDSWPEDNTFNVLHSSFDQDTKKYEAYWYDKRVPIFHTQPPGYNIGGARYFGNAVFSLKNLPTEPILANFGYLQTGVLLFTSYFADENEFSTWETETLKPLHNLVNIIKKLFNDHMASASLEKLGLSDTEYASKFIQAIKKLKFESIWKSNLRSLDADDYLGFSGLEIVSQTKSTIDLKLANKEELTEEEQKINGDEKTESDFSKIMSFINSIVNYSFAEKVWEQLEKFSTKEVVDTLLAYQIVLPDNMNPLTSVISDRSKLARSLQKIWYFNPGANANGSIRLISQRRVDLDYSSNYYLDEPLFENPTTKEFKKVSEGGVVF